MIHGSNRTAGVIQKVQRRIDAQNMVDRVMNVAGTERLFERCFAEVVRRANDAASLYATAGEEAEHRIAPMVATRSSQALLWYRAQVTSA